MPGIRRTRQSEGGVDREAGPQPRRAAGQGRQCEGQKGFKQGGIWSHLHFQRLVLAFLCGSGSSLGQRDQLEGERWGGPVWEVWEQRQTWRNKLGN